MTFTIPIWALVLIGIPVALLLLVAMGVGLFMIYHFFKGNLEIWR